MSHRQVSIVTLTTAEVKQGTEFSIASKGKDRGVIRELIWTFRGRRGYVRETRKGLRPDCHGF